MKSFAVLTAISALSSVSAASIPADWQDKVDSLSAFFAEDDTGTLNTNGYPDIYLPLIGNGYISQEKGVRSINNFVSGIFNGETTSPSHRARIPALFDYTVKGTTTIGVLSDVLQGTYHRRGYLTSDEKSWYELRWYAHRSLRNVMVLEFETHTESNATFVLTSLTDLPLKSDDFTFSDEAEIHIIHDKIYGIACGNTTIPEVATDDVMQVCIASGNREFTTEITAADSGKVSTFLFAVRTNLDVPTGDSISDAVQGDFEAAFKLAETSSLYESHVQGWADLWESGVEISGRPDVATAINASLYAILSSVRDDWPYGLAPGGLTNYYNGHSFWDTETWMYPPLLVLHPSISQSLIQYRYNRLDGARQKAASYSPAWSGTMFPWESAYSGVETCPTFAATGLREDHISGDISFAVWQEWCMRQDKEWLTNVGYPILIGVADFWISRSTYTKSADGVVTAHINGVIPPDEYVDQVNDSVYTNFVASQALRFAVLASDILGASCVQCGLYAQLAEDLVILFDETLGIHPEYEGYPGNTVKQGDVVLLHYPLGMEMTSEVQRSDLEYYSERTDHNGPAMTWGMHAIGFLDLQDFSGAAKYFNMSFQDNLHAPLQVWTETPDGNACNFITGAGGFLQTVIMGYPGFRISSDALSMSPVCPEGSTYMKVRAYSYLGNTFDFEFWCDGNTYASATDNSMYPSKVALTLKKLATGARMAKFIGEHAETLDLHLGITTTVVVSAKAAGDKPATFSLKAL